MCAEQRMPMTMSTSDLMTDLAPGRPTFTEATAEGLDRLWAAIFNEGDGFPGRVADDVEAALARRDRFCR
jgi:hypothetical protein